MLVGLDNYITTLTANAAQGALALKVADTSICTGLGSNFTKLRIGDGTFFEEVKVTGCLNGELQLAAPLAKAYIKGSCVKFTVSLSVVCELIAQGGCAAPVAAPPPAAGCARPAFVAGMPLPEFSLNTPAAHAIVWDGTGPFTVNVWIKPSWMTTTVQGNALLLGGTPLDDTANNFQATITSACGTSEINSRVCYCTAVTVAP
jgi:hypothetical protein